MIYTFWWFSGCYKLQYKLCATSKNLELTIKESYWFRLHDTEHLCILHGVQIPGAGVSLSNQLVISVRDTWYEEKFLFSCLCAFTIIFLDNLSKEFENAKKKIQKKLSGGQMGRLQQRRPDSGLCSRPTASVLRRLKAEPSRQFAHFTLNNT